MRKQQHFIKINEINNDTLNGLLLKAIFFAENQTSHQLKPEKVVASIFMEPSTRTELSFKAACSRLGYTYLDLHKDRSSLVKGEDFLDTLDVLEAMGAKTVIIRTSDESLIDDIQHRTNLNIINAGSGKTHHPTQALLDLVTMKRELGRINNLKIGIVGDLLHSRVANSTIDLHEKLGNELFFWSPKGFETKRTGPKVNHVSSDDFIKELDVLMMLRVQFERHENIAISNSDYHQAYGLTPPRLSLLKENAIIMHPGPFNRGIEISNEALEDARIKIFHQVQNAVPTRMAILQYLMEGKM